MYIGSERDVVGRLVRPLFFFSFSNLSGELGTTAVCDKARYIYTLSDVFAQLFFSLLLSSRTDVEN